MPKKWIARVANAPIIAEGIVCKVDVVVGAVILTIKDAEGVQRNWVIDMNDSNAVRFITVRDVNFLRE